MPTVTDDAGTATVVTSTWSTTANATGAQNATFAVWAVTTSGATGQLDLSGYDFSSIPVGATITDVNVSVGEYVSNTARMLAPQAQVMDGATTIGAVETLALTTTTTNVSVFTPSVLPTRTQLLSSTFKVRFTARRAANTQAANTNLDFISVEVVYSTPDALVSASTVSTVVAVPTPSSVGPPPAGLNASDDFNRADNPTSLGANYQTTSANSWQVIGNQAAPATTFASAVRWATACSTDNEWSQMTYATQVASVFVGPGVRMPALTGALNTIGDFYVFLVSGASMNTLTIRRKDNLATTLTQMDTAVTQTVAAGSVLRCEAEGTDVVGYVNGVEAIRRAMSLAPLANGGRGVGWYSTGNSSLRFDDWSGGDVTGGGGSNATATPAVVAAPAAVPAAALSVGSVVSVTEVAAPAAAPAPTVRLSVQTTPGAASAAAAVGAAQVATGNVPAPSPVAAVTAVPPPAASAGAAPAPGVVPTSVAAPAPLVQTGARPTPAAVASVAAQPTALVSTGNVPAPASVPAASAVPAPSLRTGSSASPAVAAAAASAPAPTIQAGSRPAPATVTTAAAQPAAQVSTGNVPAPASVAALVAAPAPTLRTGVTLSRPTVTAATAVPAPALSAGSRVSPAAVLAAAGVGSAVIVSGSGALVVATAVPATAGVPAPSVRTASTALTELVQALVAVAAPAVSTSALVPGQVVAVTVTIPLPARINPGFRDIEVTVLFVPRQVRVILKPRRVSVSGPQRVEGVP